MTDELRLREAIEDSIRELPIVEYAFLDTKDIPFTERVRYICENECEKYGTTWACPPAVGSVAECRSKCLEFTGAFLLATVWDVSDPLDTSNMDAINLPHEDLTRQVNKIFIEMGCKTMPLATGSCFLCKTCTYPDEPCRNPDMMLYGMDSQGILVEGLAEQCGMGFLCDGSVVSLFSLILYRQGGADDEPRT